MHKPPRPPQVHLARYFAKASNYALLAAAATTGLIYCVQGQMEGGGSQAALSKVSLLMVGQQADPLPESARIPKQKRANVTLTGGRPCVAQAVLDSYLCLVHLTTGLVVEDLFAPFAGDSQIRIPFRVFSVPFLRLRLTDRVASAGAALLMFVLFSFFEMKLIVLIWKARPCLHSALARLLALRPLSS